MSYKESLENQKQYIIKSKNNINYSLANNLYLKLMKEFYSKYKTNLLIGIINDINEVSLNYVLPYNFCTALYYNDEVLSILKDLVQ